MHGAWKLAGLWHELSGAIALGTKVSLLGFVRTRVLMSRSRLNNGATHGG